MAIDEEKLTEFLHKFVADLGATMAAGNGRRNWPAREVLLRRADGDGMIEIPMRSARWRADRMHRPPSG